MPLSHDQDAVGSWRWRSGQRKGPTRGRGQGQSPEEYPQRLRVGAHVREREAVPSLRSKRRIAGSGPQLVAQMPLWIT